jgi:hypothetical protein
MIQLKQQLVKIDKNMFDFLLIDCVLVHIGGGLWGIFAVPIFRRTIGPDVNGQFVEDTFNSIIYRITVGESWRVNKSFY